jgi:lysophospholipase L1-like esterase
VLTKYFLLLIKMDTPLLKKHKILKANIVAILIGIIISLLLFEILLRVYNPIPTRIRGNNIVLPINQIYMFSNDLNKNIDKLIIHTKNSLGFRGPEMPKNYSDYLSIIAVGGSTTECLFLSDNKDWPSILYRELQKHFYLVWLNNAGLDGHSTFGHQILLNKYVLKIKPQLILFLIGANDVGRDDLTSGFDTKILRDKYVNWLDFICKNSELINTGYNIWRVIRARKMQLSHHSIELRQQGKLDLTEEMVNSKLTKYGVELRFFKKRVENLVKTCTDNGIRPVLITQPTLWGLGIDPTTSVNLADIKTGKNINGELKWKELELYNDITRSVAKNKNVLLIDLAMLMPKDSRYYYDGLHFTNQGAEKVAEIISVALIKPLSIDYPGKTEGYQLN